MNWVLLYILIGILFYSYNYRIRFDKLLVVSIETLLWPFNIILYLISIIVQLFNKK